MHYIVAEANNTPDHLRPIMHGRTNFLIDSHNKQYLDLTSCIWNISLGYSFLQDELSLKLQETIQNGLFLLDMRYLPTTIFETYAIKLLSFVNNPLSNFCSVYYSSSGSQATEFALKLINSLSSKTCILSFDISYHGTTLGAMSLSGIDQETLKPYHKTSSDIKHVPPPKSLDDLDQLCQFLIDSQHSIAAFFIEPLLMSAGNTIIEIDFLNRLLTLCKDLSIIVVFDEIATGFYKTGTRFLFHQLDIAPDILLLSKAINNGFLPFSVTILSDKIHQQRKHTYINHFSTQDGNILTLQSADIVLDYYIKNDTILRNNVKKIEELITSYFQQNNIPFIGRGVSYSIYLNNRYIVEFIQQLLQSNGILVHIFIFTTHHTEYSGLTIVVPFNIDYEILTKALAIIANIYQTYQSHFSI